MTWEDLAKAKREAVFNKIPKEWVIEVPPVEEAPNPRVLLDKLLPDEENAITDSTAMELLDKMKTGELKAIDVATAFCHRAALAHQVINCCSEIFFERAFARAKELDEYYEKTGELYGPLHGIPVSLKDQVNLEGIDSALGFLSRVNKPKTKNDESVIATILYNAGAVFYVKTTTPMAMMSGETYSNIYGQTYNGWNRRLSPGGSSGGESSLIASKGSLIGLSTDLGGSIRIPAAFNGLFALRASWGRLPYCKVDNTMAFQPVAPSVIGPSARDRNDLVHLVKTIIDTEPWFVDPKTPPIPWRPYSVPEKLVFGFYKTNKVTTPHPPVMRAMELIKEKLIAAGHEVIEWDPPVSHKFIKERLREIFVAENYNEIMKECAITGEPKIPQLVEAWGLKGELTVSEHWEQARIQYETQQKYFKYWMDTAKSTSTGRPVDAWLTPVWETVSSIAGNPRYDKVSSYTYAVNYLNLCSVVTPITFVDKTVDVPVTDFQGYDESDNALQQTYDPELVDGMPVAVQVICQRYEEEKALEIAGVVYKATH